MFCKICFDAKKPESIYTSHRIREGFGNERKVTCPILLQVKCHACNETGHTTSYCKKTSNKKSNSRKERGGRHANHYQNPIIRIEMPKRKCQDADVRYENHYGILIQEEPDVYNSPQKSMMHYPPLSVNYHVDKVRIVSQEPPAAPIKTKRSFAEAAISDTDTSNTEELLVSVSSEAFKLLNDTVKRLQNKVQEQQKEIEELQGTIKNKNSMQNKQKPTITTTNQPILKPKVQRSLFKKSWADMMEEDEKTDYEDIGELDVDENDDEIGVLMY